MPAGEAPRRVRAAAHARLDEATRRWLISPQGLLAACRDATADHDAGFLDELAASALLGRLDDECLEAPGPAPSERVLALVCAARLALWCVHGGDRPSEIQDWLTQAITGFSGPADAPWTPPATGLDQLEAPGDPPARAAALIAAAQRGGAGTALLPVADLVRAFLPAPDDPDPTARVRIPLLTSRHHHGEIVHLAAVIRPGPPGFALDPLVCPFTRADAVFHHAVATAWQANRSLSLSARWSTISDRTGVAVEVISGRSVGAAAGTALRYLTHPGLTPLDASWAITGALDSTGALLSLLDEEHNLATYRTKLTAAGDRTVLIPTCDHPQVADLVESGGLKAHLLPVASLVEITAAAQRDAAANVAHGLAWQRSPGRPRALALQVLVPAVLGATVAVVGWMGKMGLAAAAVAGTASAATGWVIVHVLGHRGRPRVWTATVVTAALVATAAFGGLFGVRHHPRPVLTMQTFPLPPGSDPGTLVFDKHGNLWFTETSLHRIGRISVSGFLTEFAVPRLPGSMSGDPPSPYSLAVGPDGNVWFTASTDVIGSVTADGRFTEHTLEGIDLGGLTAGPDGNMWVTENVAQIARVAPSGAITEFPLPVGDANYTPSFLARTGIAVGRDGNLWFTEARGRIARITPSGTVTEFPLPTPGTQPGGIIAGPDGNLWFIEVGPAFKIGRITLSGTITEFDLLLLSYPQTLTVGSDGAIWFTELTALAGSKVSDANRIGRLDPRHPEEFPSYIPLPDDVDPAGIATGGDGNLWFTETKAHQIVTMPPVAPSEIPSVSRDAGQSLLDAFHNFRVQIVPVDERLVADEAGGDLEAIRAGYTREAEIVASFADAFGRLPFPSAVGEEVRGVIRATGQLQAVLNRGSHVASEEELHGEPPGPVGIIVAYAGTHDVWIAALNSLSTRLGTGRSRRGPGADKKLSTATPTSRASQPAGMTSTLPGRRALISGEKFPPVAIDSTGKSDPNQWPDACQLLTDAEIATLAPGVVVSRNGRNGPTEKKTFCEYALSRSSDPPTLHDSIAVSLDLVGASATVAGKIFDEDKSRATEYKRLHPENYRDYGRTLGADDAFWDGFSIRCHTGPYWLTVSGDTVQPLASGDEMGWRDKVLTQVVRTLSAKMR